MAASKAEFNAWVAEVLVKGNPVFYSLEVRVNQWLYQYCLRDSYKSTEILHEAYLRTIKALDEGKEIGNYSAWLRQVCLNVIRELAKKTRRVAFIDFQNSSYADDSELPLLALELAEMREKICIALQTLAQQDSDAAELLDWRYQQNLTWEEIQTILQRRKDDCSIDALRQRGQRARKKLRQIYHEFYSPA
jgi:RNA polymerase sigma factor (sigma-70 family)